MWKASVKDVAGEVLCVSQFTLLANTTKGSKPDFHRAMVSPPPPTVADSVLVSYAVQSSESSRQLYGVFLDKMKQLYVPERIQGNHALVAHMQGLTMLRADGQFGAMMNVSLTNEVCRSGGSVVHALGLKLYAPW